MKKKTTGFWLLMLLLTLVSCQEEESVVTSGADTLILASDLTSLLTRITMEETSLDNAIDSSNCAALELPFSAIFNGRPFVVSDSWTFAEFQSVPAGFYDGLQFPVTLMLPDGSTVVVSSQSAYDQVISGCADTAESINCVHLQYPVTVFEYDSGNQIQDELVFSSDAAFFSYLDNLQDDLYFTLQYPLSLTYGNGENLEVNSNNELISAINASYENCSVSPDPLPCVPVWLRPGLVAFYGFRNGSLEDEIGDMDLSDNGNVQPAPDRDSNPNCAMSFNYTAQTYLFSENTSVLDNLDGLSISLWFQPSTDLTGYEALISRGEGLQCPDRFGQWSVGLSDNRRAVFGRQNSAWSNVFSQQNTWYHLVAIWSSQTNSMSIYVDGDLQETVTGSANCGGEVTVADIGNLILGRDYTGKIDDVAIYNRALDSTEIEALQTLMPCCY